MENKLVEINNLLSKYPNNVFGPVGCVWFECYTRSEIENIYNKLKLCGVTRWFCLPNVEYSDSIWIDSFLFDIDITKLSLDLMILLNNNFNCDKMSIVEGLLELRWNN